MVADKLPDVGIVAIAGVFAAVPAISVLVPLGVPVIAVGFAAVSVIVVFEPLGVPAIAVKGPVVVHSYSCSGAVPLFGELASELGAVVASALRLFLVLLGPRTPFETAVHSPQLVGLHFGILPPHRTLFLVPSPRPIFPSPDGGLIGCLRGPVALPFLCLLLGGVLLRRILFAGGGTSYNLPFTSPIPCSLGGITLTFVYYNMQSP